MSDRSGLHAFAFQSGHWRVRHRRLARRLVGDTTWLEFGGTCQAFEIPGGAGNVDDFVINEPSGAYLAATFRRLDPAIGEWSIHWADARREGLDPAMRGRFVDGVGTFYGKDEVHGRPVSVRFIWSEIGPSHAPGSRPFPPMARPGRSTG